MTPRELTVYNLAKHSPFTPGEISKLLRLAASHRRLCEMECNGEGTTQQPLREGQAIKDLRWAWGERDEAKRRRIEGRIQAICKFDPAKDYGGADLYARYRTNVQGVPIVAKFSHDPRGSTVKIATADGFSNSFGGEGICL